MPAVPASSDEGLAAAGETRVAAGGARVSAGKDRAAAGAGEGPAQMGGERFSPTSAGTLTPARWRDPKRYAWLLGLIVPTLPFLAYGLVQATGLGVFWFYGPFLVFVIFPLLDLAGRDGRDEPARQRDQVAGTGSLLPLVHVRVHPDPVRRAGVRLLAVVQRQTLDARRHRADADGGDGERDRDQHRARARAQAREHGAVAEQGGARAERLRALLHRAQPRPPRARGHAGGPRERAAGGELLRVPAAHRGRQPALRWELERTRLARAWAARRGRRATTSSARGR